MKAAYYDRNGGPDVLQYGDVDVPSVGPQTVLLRVTAISLEGGDLLNRRVTPPTSNHHVGGYIAAGVVVSIGSAVEKITVGEAVVAFGWSGSHAEFSAVPEEFVFPYPGHLDEGLAATVPIAFGTASDALFRAGQLQRGETVLIQGAAGGVGLAAVQLAAAAGARVIVTASSNVRLDRLRAFGADAGINYRTSDIGKEARALTGGEGCNLAVDLAGGDLAHQVLDAVRDGGRVAVVGASSGAPSVVSYADIIMKRLSVFGVLFGLDMHTPRVHRLIARLFADVVDGRMRMPIADTFALAEARAAHAYAETGHPFGRVLIRP